MACVDTICVCVSFEKTLHHATLALVSQEERKQLSESDRGEEGAAAITNWTNVCCCLSRHRPQGNSLLKCVITSVGSITVCSMPNMHCSNQGCVQ